MQWDYGNGDMELKMEITKKNCFDNCPTTENRQPGCQVKRGGNEAISNVINKINGQVAFLFETK